MIHTSDKMINPYTMKKAELLLFLTGHCKHFHLYCEHPQCYLKEQNKELKIGYLDIETTGFEANYHHILTYCIKTRDKKEYFTGTITKRDLERNEWDRRICKELFRDMLRYDVLVTYYGTRFDIPFIRARCLYWKLPFAKFGSIKHKDVYYMVRNKLKLHRNSMEAAAVFFGIKGKDHVEGAVWMAARNGNTWALKMVLAHNKKDSEITEKIHKELEMYEKGILRSI